MTADASLYITFNSEIGLQFFKLIRDLFCFGIQVITPCFCVILNEPFRYLQFKDCKIKRPMSVQKI